LYQRSREVPRTSVQRKEAKTKKKLMSEKEIWEQKQRELRHQQQQQKKQEKPETQGEQATPEKNVAEPERKEQHAKKRKNGEKKERKTKKKKQKTDATTEAANGNSEKVDDATERPLLKDLKWEQTVVEILKRAPKRKLSLKKLRSQAVNTLLEQAKSTLENMFDEKLNEMTQSITRKGKHVSLKDSLDAK